MPNERKVVQCHRSEFVIDREGIRHRAREIVYSPFSDVRAVTECHRSIEVPKAFKSPIQTRSCEGCYR